MPSPGTYDGQITCSRERTDHVLSTRSRGLLLNGGRRPGTLPSLMTPGHPPGALKGALMDFVLALVAVISVLLAAASRTLITATRARTKSISAPFRAPGGWPGVMRDGRVPGRRPPFKSKPRLRVEST